MPTENTTVHAERLSIDGPDGRFEAYFAAPDATPVPGVLVLQEIFGVNGHIRSVVDRFAAAGYAALAPDVFWRIRPGIELGYDDDDIAKGREYKAAMNMDEAIRDLGAALERLRAHPACSGKVGVTGYCYGGLLCFVTAARLEPDCASSYYGGGIPEYLSEIDRVRCPIQFHFGAEDGSIPMEQVEQVRQAAGGLENCEIFVYDNAGHGFHCDQRGSYDRDSAELAWERTLGLFSRYLG